MQETTYSLLLNCEQLNLHLPKKLEVKKKRKIDINNILVCDNNGQNVYTQGWHMDLPWEICHCSCTMLILTLSSYVIVIGMIKFQGNGYFSI